MIPAPRTRITIAREVTEDRQVNAAQENAIRTAKSANAVPFIGPGVVLDYTFTVTSFSQTLAHKLERAPQGWIVLRRRDSGASVYESASDALTLTLTASASARIRVWVF